ncbi:MAG: hypothetical protein EZS28_018058, partial [Streblomastix strix]
QQTEGLLGNEDKLFKYISKPGAGKHQFGYGEGQIEIQEVILRHARGETISNADWRKFLKELDIDLKLDAVRLQSPVSDSDEYGKKMDQSTAFWINSIMRYRQDDRSNSGGNNQNFQPRQNNRDNFRLQGRVQRGGREYYRGRGYGGNIGSHNRDNCAMNTFYSDNNHNLSSVAPWIPVQLVPATSSNTVVPELSQRQICGPTPQLVRTSDSRKFNKTPSCKQQLKQLTLPQSTPKSSKITNYNIITIPTPSLHQMQQEQDHLLQQYVAVSAPPINPANIVQPPKIETQLSNIIQPANNTLVSLPDLQNSWTSITTQPTGLDLRAEQEVKMLHNQMLHQKNRGLKRIPDPLETKSIEQSSEDFNRRKAYEFRSQNQTPSQDQQEYSNNSDDNRIQRDVDHNSNDDVFGKADQIELQVRDHSGRVMKSRSRGKAQSQAQPVLSNHRPIQESTQFKLKFSVQRRGRTGTANGTIGPSEQSSHIKQIAGGSNYNFGSSMEIDIEKMMERDLTLTQRTTNDGPIVSTAPPQLVTESWNAGGDTANVFAAQHANIQHLNDGNEMNIPQQAHLAAQGVDGLGFQPLMDPEQEKSEDEPEQDQGQLDLTIFQIIQKMKAHLGQQKNPDGTKRIKATSNHALNLPVRRIQAADRAKIASGRFMLVQICRHQFGGTTSSDSSLERLISKITITTWLQTHEINLNLVDNQLQRYIIEWIFPNYQRQQLSRETLKNNGTMSLPRELNRNASTQNEVIR